MAIPVSAVLISLPLNWRSVATILTNVISLMLALGLNSKIRAKSFFRAAYFLPNVLGALVVGYIFQYLFTYIIPALGRDDRKPGFEPEPALQ